MNEKEEARKKKTYVEKLGIEPSTFPMQMERHTTRPYPHKIVGYVVYFEYMK